jgi:hypothetical protein
MTFEKFLLASLTACALAACAPPAKETAGETPSPQESDAGAVDAQDGPPVTTPDPVPGDCDAAAYQSLIGTNVAAVTLPADLVHRIYKEGDAVTMDYRPDRLNIVTDENGVIIEVKCG